MIMTIETIRVLLDAVRDVRVLVEAISELVDSIRGPEKSGF